MAFIKLDKDQPTNPKLYDTVDRIIEEVLQPRHTDRVQLGEIEVPTEVAREIVRNAVLGGLVTLWCYADRHISDDNVMPVSVTGASQICGLPVTWLEELPAHWLIVREDGTVELPNYRRKNRLIPKEERKGGSETPGAVRTRRYRARKAQRAGSNGDASRTSPKRHPTGTGTGTVIPVPKPGSAAPLAAANGAAATPRESEPEGPLSDIELAYQIKLLRALHWTDERILAKWGRRGMTKAHLAGPPP